MYIQRTIEKSIERANKFFPVVLVTGPRQVGKQRFAKLRNPASDLCFLRHLGKQRAGKK